MTPLSPHYVQDSLSLCLLFEALASKSEVERVYSSSFVDGGDDIPSSSDDQGHDAEMLAQIDLFLKAGKIRAWMNVHAGTLLKGVSFLYLAFPRAPMYRFPLEASLLINLKELVIENHRLHDLPSELNLPHLTFLSLNHNDFDTIAAPINRLPKLRTLSLENNRFTKWDSNVETGCLVGLEVLRLAGNPFSGSMAKIDELKGLRFCDIHFISFCKTADIMPASDGHNRDS